MVAVDGSEVHAGALAEFADGREKLVLVVRGASAPAPLARCITPGTLVLQTDDGRGLDRVAAFDGPAIAAIVPEGAADVPARSRRGPRIVAAPDDLERW